VYREKAGLDGSTPLKTYASGWSAGCRDAFAAAKGWSCSTAWSTSNNPGVQSCLDRYLAKAGITTAQRQAQWTNTCVNLFKAEGGVCGAGTWDAECVNAVSSQCGMSCTGWGKECIDEVARTCGAFCSTNGTCAHSYCLLGGKLASGCDPCVTSICALRPSCCSGSWDTNCLAMVGGVCGITCADPAMAGTNGQCQPTTISRCARQSTRWRGCWQGSSPSASTCSISVCAGSRSTPRTPPRALPHPTCAS